MKKRILVLSILPLSVIFGFIPYIQPDSLKLYPKPQYLSLSFPILCSLNVFQPKIRLVIGNDSSLTRTAAEVCTTEIRKAFYFAIKPVGNKIDSITIKRQDNLPSDNQDVQIIFVLGKRGDLLVNNVLSELEISQSDIPGGDTTEGYLLTGKARKTGQKRLLVLCAGNTNIGSFRGTSTLRELIAQHCQGLLPTSFKIRDWPDCPWREASWAGLEVGCDITKPDEVALRSAQLDYFSLLKCGQVEHSNHRFYFMPDSLKTPPGGDALKIGLMMDRYSSDVAANNLPNFWYPKYRHRGIEPMPHSTSKCNIKRSDF